MKKAKVGYSAASIMSSLYGSKGRPETNEYNKRLARQGRTEFKEKSLTVVEEYRPKAPKPPAESPRTASKWAAARARNTSKS